MFPFPIMSPSGTPYTEESLSANGSGSGALYTMFDRAWAIDNSAIIETMAVYSTVSATIVVKIGLENGGGSYNIVVSQSYSHGGSGWETVTLSSPYTVPASGTYRAGLYSATTLNSRGSNARAYKLNDQTGSPNTGFTEDTSNAPVLRVSGTK